MSFSFTRASIVFDNKRIGIGMIEPIFPLTGCSRRTTLQVEH